VSTVKRLGEWLWGSPYVLLSIAAFCWASNSVIGRAVRDTIPPVALAFWRWFLAAVLMTVLAWAQLGKERAAILAQWPCIAAAGGLGVAGFSLLLYYGLHGTTAVNSLLVQAAQPCVTLVALAALFGEKPTARMVVGLLLSLAGVAAIVARGPVAGRLTLSTNPGDLLILAVTVAYSLYTILVSRLSLRDPIVAAAAIFVAGALWLAPVYGAEILAGRVMVVTPATVAAILYAAVFPSCLAYIFYNRTVVLIGPARAGSVTNLMPIFGTLLAMLTLSERLYGYQLLGISLVIAGIFLVRARAANAS
jgi:drug/metabolite transporter (DMT)-like permease